MPNQTAKAAEARQKQSAASKAATLDLLKGKRQASTEFSIYLPDETGGKQEVTLKYHAIGARDYDKLISKYPPKAEQRVEGAAFDIDKFAPALIAACCVEPEMSVADAQEIWDSPDWSRGDLMALFRRAVDLNNQGIDIPFNEND